MKKRIVAAVLMIIAGVSLSTLNAENVRAGKLLNKELYLQTDELKVDTLGWEIFSEDFPAKTGKEPSGFTEVPSKLLERNFKLFRLKNCSALSVALIDQLGLKVIALTQWSFDLTGNIKVYGPGMKDGYKKQRIVSDYIWEMVDKVSIGSGTKVDEDFHIQLHFFENGFSEYRGKDDMSKVGKLLQSSNSDFNLVFIDKKSQRPNGIRKVYALYVLVEKTRKASSIIKEIEKQMDAMKIDISFKTPLLTEVN